MGRETYPIPMKDLFVANRDRLMKNIRDQNNASNECYIYMVGGKATMRYDSDHEPLFRQESYFWYLTGVKEPDCRLIIDISKNKIILLIPRLPADYATIMGEILTPEQWKIHYQMDEVFFTDETDEILEQYLTGKTETEKARKLLLLKGMNSDSGSIYEPPAVKDSVKGFVDEELLFPILAECRVIKSNAELALLQHVTEVTSFAHSYVMRNIKPGMMEYQGESLFRHYCYYNYGCRLLGYTPICGCGPSAAVLHYGHSGEPNARQTEDGGICLFDMGAEYFGYGSDVTCSFPVNGVFSEKQIPIYTGVFNAQVAVYNMMKPGVSFVDCHKAAEVEILKALAGIGIVRVGDKTFEDLVEMRLGAVFMPHGLGHFIGIDTHDVGGYLAGHTKRATEPGLKSLRTSRILKKDMTLTVEPGCYFIDHLLNGALEEDSSLRQYLDPVLVDEYRGFGGVRLEDVLAVTEDGCTNYTLCPRTIEEVELVMKGGNWPPVKDEAPQLRRSRLTDPVPLPAPPSA